MFANKINTVTFHPVNKHYQTFCRNQMLYSYKFFENILKTLI